MNIFKLLTIATCTLLLSACQQNPPQENALASSSWTFAYFMDKESNAKTVWQEDKKMEMYFTDTENVHVKGYCNSGQGKYNVRGRTISLSGIAMTEIGCMPVHMNDMETRLVTGLLKAESFERTQDSLKIFSSGQYDLSFYRKE